MKPIETEFRVIKLRDARFTVELKRWRFGRWKTWRLPVTGQIRYFNSINDARIEVNQAAKQSVEERRDKARRAVNKEVQAEKQRRKRHRIVYEGLLLDGKIEDSAYCIDIDNILDNIENERWVSGVPTQHNAQSPRRGER